MHAQAVFFLLFFFNSKQNGSRNFTETGTCPRAKTLSSYERAGGKRRGVKMLWLTKKTKTKEKWRKKKKNPGFFFFNQLWHFPPVFPNDAITLRICLSILSPFWCICKERENNFSTLVWSLIKQVTFLA